MWTLQIPLRSECLCGKRFSDSALAPPPPFFTNHLRDTQINKLYCGAQSKAEDVFSNWHCLQDCFGAARPFTGIQSAVGQPPPVQASEGLWSWLTCAPVLVVWAVPGSHHSPLSSSCPLFIPLFPSWEGKLSVRISQWKEGTGS